MSAHARRPGWPICFAEVLAARERIRPYVRPTPLRSYGPLDEAVGGGVRLFVKHENHNPTNAFKVRNGISVMTALSAEERKRGVVAASRGNWGQGLAWAGRALGVPVTICVPAGNNPEKNAAVKGFGADLIEEGRDYDEAVCVAERLVESRGLRFVHATNDPLVVAGAATFTLEIFEEIGSLPDGGSLDALVLSVGGGSQAVGALVVTRELSPATTVYGVQARQAATIHDSWHARRPLTGVLADTIADGLATRLVYEGTFTALLEGLAGFVTVTEAEIAAAVRLLLKTTHNLAEGAGAAGLAGLLALREKLAGRSVAIVISGSNIDEATLRRVLTGA